MFHTNNKELLYTHIKALNILCVEDDNSTRLILSSILKGLVNNIIVAVDGADGYDKFLKNEIDIIITDYKMPIQNGLDMVEKIKKVDNSVPVILISAMEDLNIFIQALNLEINAFVKKPIERNELTNALEKTAKVYIANKYLADQKNEQIRELKAKADYSMHQEDRAFAKELNILRNDYYYQMTDYNDNVSLLDFLYHPKDVMSGDAYSARHIDEESSLYIVVDGMGKGLSASLTAMIFISFANHIIDKMLFLDDFDFSILINETMEYIKPILLEEESLSVDYVLINNKEEKLIYSKFSMPPILMQNQNNEIIKLKSNNPTMSKYSPTFNIDSFDIKGITKFLIYSDGMVENETIYDHKPYSHFIEDDFLKSFTREDLNHSFIEKIKDQEDDITLIFVNQITRYSISIAHKKFKSSLENMEVASKWYEELWNDLTSDKKVSYRAAMVFTELFMNAHEHGNLAIPSKIKQSLMENDTYFETLAEKEKGCEKYIEVIVDQVNHMDDIYIITKITDEGNGFDTQILSEIFRNSKKFHGRGVFVSRKNSFGIYYNSKGNSVLFINKIENQTS